MAEQDKQSRKQNREPSPADQTRKASPFVTPRHVDPTWQPPSFVSSADQPQSAKETGASSETAAQSQPTPQPEAPYDYAEEYYPNSATQSYLHDSYYPHLYYQDWHETEYDETDRAQDYYHDAAHDEQARYREESYRDQEQYRQQDYYRDYDSSYGTSSYSKAANDTFAPSALSAAGIMATGEAYAQYAVNSESRATESTWPSYTESADAPSSQAVESTPVSAYQHPETAYPLNARSDYHTSPSLQEDQNQLIINREESIPSAAYSSEDNRLTVNRNEDVQPLVNQPLGEYPSFAYEASSVVPISHSDETNQSLIGRSMEDYPPSAYSQERIAESASGAYFDTPASEDSSRLIISRAENFPSAVDSYEDSRLTINRPMDDNPSPAYPQETMAASLINPHFEMFPSKDAGRFVAYQQDSNIIPANTPQAESFTIPTIANSYDNQGYPSLAQEPIFDFSQPTVTDALMQTDTNQLTVNQPMSDSPSLAYTSERMADALTTPTYLHERMGQESLQPLSDGYGHTSAMSDRAERIGAPLHAEESPVVDSMLSTTSVSDPQAAFVFTSDAAASAAIDNRIVSDMASASTTPYHDPLSSGDSLREPEQASDIPIAHPDDANRLMINRGGDSPASINETESGRLTINRPEDVLEPSIAHASTTPEESLHSILLHTDASPEPNVASTPIAPSDSSIPSKEADWALRFSEPLNAESSIVQSTIEQFAWHERTVEDVDTYQSYIGAARLLIRDKGPDAEEGRFGWSLIDEGEEKPVCLLSGRSDSLQSAETELVIQAHRHGLIGDLETESLLVQSSSPKEKAAEYLLQTHADIQEEKKILQDGILSDAPEDGLLEPDIAKTAKSGKAKEHAALAGTAALGVLGFAGQTALKAGQTARRTASRLATIATHEDEEFGKMDDARIIIEEAVAKELPKHRARKEKTLLRDAKRTVVNQLIEHDGDRAAHDATMSDKTTTTARAGVRDQDAAADAKQILEKRQAERVLSKKKSGAEEGLTQSKTKAAKHSLSKEEIAEAQLIDKREKSPKGKEKKERSEKKPATKRERDLAKKKKEIADAKMDKTGRALTMLSPVQAAKRGAIAGAGVAKNVAASSVFKVLTKENEDLATLASMTGTTKRAMHSAQRVARIPQKAIRTVRKTAELLREVGAMVAHAIASFFSLGWPVILMLIFMLIMVAVVVASTLSVWNKPQEISEVSALVAKLDEDLEAKIHSYGHRGEDNLTIPIYYCDARGTYNTFDENGHDLTKDVDLKDDASDLETVDAASIEVFTNPDGIIAYIDAKYEGEWQVGAASWKVTVDWNGKTYNIFDWEHVPEFVQKGLNEVDQIKFEGTLADTIGAYLVDEFYGGYDKMTAEEAEEARRMAETIAEELGNVIYDQQLQGVSDEVIYEAIRAGIKQHKNGMELSDDQLTTLNYEIMASVTDLVGEQEPVALVYDEIVELHKLLNYWSEDYEHIDTTKTAGGGIGGGGGSGASTTSNAYGYPNSSGYDPDELAKWDGYNEVSVYGISEPGTTSITADGTRITNDWSDTNMAIACEGLQNAYFAYWTSSYKQLHEDSSQPVRITMYNPATGATVTAEVRDCGGWRGFNPKYAGMNATRQWDLLPAVWKALGGTESSGLMNVYWKVDNEATVTGAVPGMAAAEIVIGEYPWEKETDNIDGNLTVNRATYIRHEIQDLMHNVPLLEEIVGRDNFASDDEFYAVIEFVTAKLKDIMKPVLTMDNVNRTSFTDYMMTRRELGDPFGKAGDGSAAQWVIAERFNPGFEDSFDRDKVSVGIKPLNGDFSIYAVKKGTVSEIDGNKVVISVEIDTNSIEYFVYDNVANIQVSVGDEVRSGTKLGTLADRNGSLKLSWYESFIDRYDLEWQRSWAYNPALFMQGFAGYAEPDAPSEYVGGSARSLEDCETIVDFAYSRLGCPYVWGATGPNTFDCSGLTQWCYAQAGISIPRTSSEQHDAAAAAGNIIPLDESQLQPGDILWKPGHVAIYIGSNQYIHAPQTGDVVKISTGISYFQLGLRYGG